MVSTDSELALGIEKDRTIRQIMLGKQFGGRGPRLTLEILPVHFRSL